MAARRMDISALLCDDDDRNDDPASPLISHPVILAPHLRGKHARRMPTTPTASSPSNHNYIPGPRDAPLSSSPTTTESMSDPHHRPRTIDALLHHSPRAPPQISPRPSSSHSHSSVNALLNPHPVRSSSNSSPFVRLLLFLTWLSYLSLHTDIFTLSPKVSCTPCIPISSLSRPSTTHGPRRSRSCRLRGAQAHQCRFLNQRCNQSGPRPRCASR
jgi:hypothetical protein